MIALVVLLFLWAGTASGFTWTTQRYARRLLRRTRAHAATVTATPAVCILRPCEGHDAGLADNLRSSWAAAYGGARRVVVLVPSVSDPAHAVAAALGGEAAAAGVGYEVRVTDIDTAANRKVAQLTVGERGVVEDVLVTADSDIRFDDATLPSLLRELEVDANAAASTMPPVEVAPRTLGDYASAAVLSSTAHAFLALAGLADHAGGAQHLCGSIVAYRRERLAAVGGFASLEPFLGEDFEVARRFHERGWTVPTAALPARNFDAGRTLGAVVRRFARWSVVTRQQRPHLYASYFGFLACAPLLAALTATVLATRPPLWWAGVAMAGVFVVSRIALAVELRRAVGLRADPFRAAAAAFTGELVILAGAIGALGTPVVEWRGHRYRVGAGGLMALIAKGRP